MMTNNVVVQLPQDQQEMLLDIMQNRHIDMRRKEVAADAETSLAAFRAGELIPQSAEDVIAELRESLADGCASHFGSATYIVCT